METKRIEQMIKQLQHLSKIVKNNENAENTKLTHETLTAIEKMKLDLLTKLYSMETKQIKISELVPQGYEIDKEKSTFENIILKPIEVKLPLSVEEIKDLKVNKYDDELEALKELIHLRDAWNEGWKADWCNSDESKYYIYVYKKEILFGVSYQYNYVLHFKTRELAEKFAEQFEDLINEAKELL